MSTNPSAERPTSLRIAVYGIVNAGKSSLINALLGQDIQATAPTGGTTRDVTELNWDSWVVEIGGRSLHVLDTPGLEEIGDGRTGQIAEQAARECDLVLFVIAEDLTDSAYLALLALHRIGKPLIVVLNKVDLLDEVEKASVLDKVRERLTGYLSPELVIPVAAAPLSRIRRIGPDGISRLETIRGEPEIAPLRDRLLEWLPQTVDGLQSLNETSAAVDRWRLTSETERAERRNRASQVADESSAGLALAMAVNPIPLLDFLAGPGGLIVLVYRVSDVYGERPTTEMAKKLATELLRAGMLTMWGSVAGIAAGGLLKFVPGLGHLAGAVTQGASAGYFAHVVGRALVDYLDRGHDWGEAGLVARLEEIAAATDRHTLTRGLVDQIRQRLKSPT